MGIEARREQLQAIAAWRRHRNVQHPLCMNRYQHEVNALFGVDSAKLPSDSPLPEMAQGVDATRMCGIFQTWPQQAVVLEAGSGLAIDSQALGSTVQEAHSHQQDLVSVVRACVQQSSALLGQVSFSTGPSSKMTRVRQLLAQLDTAGNHYGIGLKAHQPKTQTLATSTHLCRSSCYPAGLVAFLGE